MKIVVNSCYGGFSISREAAEFMAARGNKFAKKELKTKYKDEKKKTHWYGYIECERTDPDLVAAVEELGDKANGNLAALRVADIPDNIEYYIDNYDGIETVHEVHESW